MLRERARDPYICSVEDCPFSEGHTPGVTFRHVSTRKQTSHLRRSTSIRRHDCRPGRGRFGNRLQQQRFIGYRRLSCRLDRRRLKWWRDGDRYRWTCQRHGRRDRLRRRPRHIRRCHRLRRLVGDGGHNGHRWQRRFPLRWRDRFGGQDRWRGWRCFHGRSGRRSERGARSGLHGRVRDAEEPRLRGCRLSRQLSGPCGKRCFGARHLQGSIHGNGSMHVQAGRHEVDLLIGRTAPGAGDGPMHGHRVCLDLLCDRPRCDLGPVGLVHGSQRGLSITILTP